MLLWPISIESGPVERLFGQAPATPPPLSAQSISRQRPWRKWHARWESSGRWVPVPVSHRSGLARPTSSFSSSPNSMGTPLTSTTRASTLRPLTSRNSSSAAITTRAAIQPPRLVTAKAAVSTHPACWSCHANRPSIAPRSPGKVGYAHASTNTAAVTANPTAMPPPA